MQHKEVVLTGVSGFLGSHLAKYIYNNYSVLSVGRRQEVYKWDELSLIPKDVYGYIHLAGKAHDTNNTGGLKEYVEINVGLTKSIFDVFVRSNAKVFVYVSSVKAVADHIEGILFEDTPANPRTPYGYSKLKAEEYLREKILKGKRVVILRPCMIHGPGNKGNLNLLYQIISKGVPYPLAAFENKRSFLSVYNICYTIKRILDDTTFSSGIYNISDDKPLSTNELVSIMASICNRNVKMIRIPKTIITGVARLGDIFRLPVNSHMLKKLTENYVVSNAKIKKELGIDTFSMDALSGLTHTVESFAASTSHRNGI